MANTPQAPDGADHLADHLADKMIARHAMNVALGLLSRVPLTEPDISRARRTLRHALRNIDKVGAA